MLLGKAGVLAFTRLKYIGFPSGFLVKPEGLPEEVSKKLMTYVHDSMKEVSELRSVHKYSRIVIAEENYVVLGVTGYLRDMVNDGFDGADKAGRLGYGFFGYIWKREEFVDVGKFPVIGEFTKILEEWVRPHWEDSEVSNWALQEKLSSYTYEVQMGETAELADYYPNEVVNGVSLNDASEAEQLLQWAINNASIGTHVSVCTNMYVYSPKYFETIFEYITRLNGETIKREVVPAVLEEEISEQEEAESESTKEESEERVEEKSKMNILPVIFIRGLVAAVLLGIFVPGGKIAAGILAVVLLGAAGIRYIHLAKIKKEVKSDEGEESGKAVEDETEEITEENKEETSGPVKTERETKKETTEDLFRL